MSTRYAPGTMVELPDPERTRALGAAIAASCQPGDLVVLTGPLGAGKTVLAQGIGSGLGVVEPVVSPTFVISRIYRSGRLPLVHVDAYRLGSMAEVDDLDLDTDLTDAVLVVEWGEGLVEQLAESHLLLRIRRGDGDSRSAELTATGASWRRRLAAIHADVGA